MPTVLRWQGYRFLFWSGHRAEPPHVHVKRDRAEAKIWLPPVELEKSVDFAGHKLTEILRKVDEQQAHLLRAWHEHFGR